MIVQVEFNHWEEREINCGLGIAAYTDAHAESPTSIARRTEFHILTGGDNNVR
jgi:hypothetical protein